MTTTRQAQDLCGRDRGRTIACYDQPSGDSITGTIVGIDHTQHGVYIWVAGAYGSYQLGHEQQVTITGAGVAPKPHINIERTTA